MSPSRIVVGVFAALLLSAIVRAQITQPMVVMAITLPDGSTQDVKTRANTLGRLKLREGQEFAFRPSMLDAKNERFTVAIFKMDPGENLGDVEVRAGGAAVESKTNPAFKVRITSVTGS